MLALFVSWTIISFILFTLGDILIVLYNKVCKRNEEYNITDKLLLGLCALVIPLSISSLWFPSNENFLFISILICIIYWGIFRKRAYNLYSHNVKYITKSHLSTFETVLIFVFIIVSFYFFSWEQDVYDSLFYHHQNIRWNEEYAVVPGLANLDDRLGFNSNYFLLSAIFTFRFLIGEAIYPLQSLIVTAIGCWILHQLFKSKYEIKRVVILLAYILLYWLSIYFLRNTSTDILPNFIVFYLIARIILQPHLLKSNYLTGIILPVFLLTCKLSFFPIGLISIYLLYYLIKEKKYKIIAFLCSIGLLIIIPWLIRNVIISGYIIYPFYQLDLFSFDWKVPKEIAIRHTGYIFDIGYYFFRIAVRYPHTSIRDPLAINILTDITYIFSFLSLVYISYLIVKKRKGIQPHIYLLFAVFILSIIVWAKGGPDIRFVSGILCALICLGTILFIRKRKSIILGGKIISSTFILSIAIWSSYCFLNFYSSDPNIFSHILNRPYSSKDQLKAKSIVLEKTFSVYNLNNNQYIWTTPDLSYDQLPATAAGHFSKFLPIECLEARGYSLQDGFRAKEECK